MNGIDYNIDMIDTITGAMNMHHDRETEVRNEQAIVDRQLQAKKDLAAAIQHAKHNLSLTDIKYSGECMSKEVAEGIREHAKEFYSMPKGSGRAKELEGLIGRLMLAQILEDLIDG